MGKTLFAGNTAFGAALGIVFPSFLLSVQVLAFFFGFLAVDIACSMARVNGQPPPRGYHCFGRYHHIPCGRSLLINP